MNFCKRKIGTMCMALILVAGAVIHASDSLPPPVVNSTADLDLTHRARMALAAEPDLKDVHVLISIVDGGLVAGGPVGSTEIAARVEQVLKSIPGVRSVRMSCWVPAAFSDPLRGALRKRVASNASSTAQPAVPELDRSPIARPHPPVSAESAYASRAAAPESKRFATALPPLWPPMTLSSQNQAGKVMVQSYSPVPPPVPPAPPGPSTYPSIQPPSLPITPSQDVATALEIIRRSDPRFSRLVLKSNAGIVSIDGVVRDLEEAWELAEKLRSIPGVDRIILGRVQER